MKKPKGDPGRLVVRGASPDDRPINPPAKAQRKAAPPQAPAPAPSPPVEEPIGQPGPSFGDWQTFDTANFRIYHQDAALARRVAARAELARREAIVRWTGEAPRVAWSPRCDLFLYPDAARFSAETGQPPESPGFSTPGLRAGRVVDRKVRLRADFPKVVEAVVPHEVTHIVLADLFPIKQIPRWADEGMAVLSEPEAERLLRMRDLATPLERNALFGLDVLMSSDYPGGNHWPLYYAQSISLTKYLVGLGTPPQFVAFVRESQRSGWDAALKKSYGIASVAELDRKWRDHARTTAAAETASAEKAGEPVRR